MADSSQKDVLERRKTDFAEVVDFSMRVSLKMKGEPASEQSRLASMVHTKMCVTGSSTQHMLSAPLTDHSAIIALCRMLMEASILYFYLMEIVGADEWTVRYLCLKLHDTANRIKFLRAHESADQYSDLQAGRDQLISELKAATYFQSLDQQQQDRILTGDHFYLRGMNHAARAAGWDFDKFLSFYSYFSSHAHSSPMSFLRMRQHKIDFTDPSDAQKAAMATALGVAEYSLLKTTLAHLDLSASAKDSFNNRELERLQKSLEEWYKHFAPGRFTPRVPTRLKADKPKKLRKLKARLPRGLEDRGPEAVNATRVMVEKIRAVYERYGFEPVETPAFEYTDALGKFLPDQDRPNEGVFSFQDDDEQWISLRYDLTAPLARYVAETFDSLPKPYRSYRAGYVYRNEKPGPGRFRQFMQFDADTVGSASPAADAEMCMMAADTMEALGIPRGSYVVKVNNRKVLDGVMESIGLGGEENAGRRLTVLRAIDKYDRLGDEGVRALLGPGRKDESGDFTQGAGLNDEQIYSLMAFFEMKVVDPSEQTDIQDLNFNWHVLNSVAQLKLFMASSSYAEGIKELNEIAQLCSAAAYGYSRIRIDPSVVRGLEYYTGPVYEVELLLDTKDEKGRPVRFGSVGGGGRYDGLVSRFRAETVPATGFSIGVSRLQAALAMLDKLDTRPEFGPVVVTVFDRDRVADYQKMVAALRAANIRAELYLGNPKNMGNQLKYADKRNSPCVIIQGSDEKARGEVQIKDLIEGAKAAAAIASNQEWRESRPAQFSCREEEMVVKVREVLARHDVKWG